MDSYGKIFMACYSGSMYGAGLPVFALWPWMLAHADENGKVEVNPERVAHELGCVAQQLVEALEFLQRPDPKSRSKTEDGRRIVKISEFGYHLVNYAEYQQKGRNRSEYWRKWREDRRNSGATVAQQRATARNSAQRRATPATATATATARTSKKAALSLSQESLRLQNLLLSLILARKPDFKKPGPDAWAKEIDRMIRLDGRDPAAIERVIQWCQADVFWQNNILSAPKLRKQFDQLEMKMQEASTNARRTSRQVNGQRNRDYAAQRSDIGSTIET